MNISFVDKYNEIDQNQWDALMQDSECANVFQSRVCYDFYANLSFVETFVCAVSEDGIVKGIVVGIIQKDGGKIKQYLSRRAIINGGPLLADDISEEALCLLLSGIKEKLKHKVIYIETRNLCDYSKWKLNFCNEDFVYEPHLNVFVDTPAEDVVLKNIHKHRKQTLRTAEKYGATLIENPTIEQVKKYYDILKELYITKVKTPLFPFEFFEKLYYSRLGHFVLIQYNNEIISGAVCMRSFNGVLYLLYLAGMDREYHKIAPSSLALYESLQSSAREGYNYFDMMGAGKPGVPYGVRDFKLSFGGRLVEYGRFEWIANKFLYQIGKMGVKILKKL